MKCAIYARVSTRREEQKNSLQNQIALAESIAKENGFTIVGVNADLILTHHRRFRIDPPGDFCWLGRRGGAVGSSPHFFTESVTVPPNIDDVGMV